MPRWLLANWKMYGSTGLLRQWVSAVHPVAGRGTVQVGLLPSFTLLPPAAQLLHAAAADDIKLGAQALNPRPEGPLTGEVSPAMLVEAGCSMVLVGHSERRQHFAESDMDVAERALAARNAGLMPVICVGESGEERRAGRTESALTRQMAPVKGAFVSPLPGPLPIIAYEPVWAIGTGEVPSLSDIEAAHRHIRRQLPNGVDRQSVAVLYGGSVKPDNIESILACQQVNGALVGGASLYPEQFADMLRTAQGG